MVAPPNSQVAPLPSNLPFRLVSKTIGAGAYASVRKAVPRNASGPVVAIKFINKDHAMRVGRLRPRQIELEIALHSLVSAPNQHIIQFLGYDQDPAWYWVAMELAEGGDLFDKIEADEGVGEEIAHFYFKQLISAIAWCHSKGVAHRDIKPENMLLTGDGDLKLADFGLAIKFMDVRTGQVKSSGLVCGSPPYIAPEIVKVGNDSLKRKTDARMEKPGYAADITDIWSCAIVLFVLLVGNTPWDSPVPQQSAEYTEFLETKGRPDDELWQKIPSDILSLLRGMLRVDANQRFTLHDIRTHPWFTRPNKYMNDQGTALDSVNLATSMMERLRIDFSQVPTSQPSAMNIDSQPAEWRAAFASTQPETPIANLVAFDWEAPPRFSIPHGAKSSSQPTTALDRNQAGMLSEKAQMAQRKMNEDPSMSQFSATPQVPLSLTQYAKQFRDVVPAHSLAQFYSIMPLAQLVSLLDSALHQLNIPVPSVSRPQADSKTFIWIKTVDGRRQPLVGSIIVEWSEADDMFLVRFVKAKGDPLEWRRFFKRVAVFCQDGVWKGPQDE